MATVFFASSLALAYMSSQRSHHGRQRAGNAAPLDLSGEEAPTADAIAQRTVANATEGTESPDALLPDLDPSCRVDGSRCGRCGAARAGTRGRWTNAPQQRR